MTQIDKLSHFAAAMIDGPYGTMKFLVRYSVKIDAADHDYLAVYENLPLPVVARMGMLDLHALDIKTLDSCRQLLDPMVVEPMLKGHCLLGDTDMFFKFRDEVKETTPTKEAISHLLANSINSLQNVARTTSLPQRLSASELLFSIGYWSLAQVYAQTHCKAITVDLAIEKQDSEVQRIWNQTTIMKKGGTNKLQEMLQAWEFYLAGGHHVARSIPQSILQLRKMQSVQTNENNGYHAFP